MNRDQARLIACSCGRCTAMIGSSTTRTDTWLDVHEGTVLITTCRVGMSPMLQVHTQDAAWRAECRHNCNEGERATLGVNRRLGHVDVSQLR